MAETSDDMSKLAARYMRFSPGQLAVEVRSRPEALASDIRRMAASLVRQDETTGLRGFIRKAMGK
jgi:hypothetical protein